MYGGGGFHPRSSSWVAMNIFLISVVEEIEYGRHCRIVRHCVDHDSFFMSGISGWN